MPPEEVEADRDGDVPVRSVVEVAALAVLAVEIRSVEPRRHAVILAPGLSQSEPGSRSWTGSPRARYGTIFVIRVPQLPKKARVPPQVVSAAKTSNVQVCPMYSLAM